MYRVKGSLPKDDEVKGRGNSYDFGARMYDGRLGRWLSRDVKFVKYPSFSPYIGIGNNPLVFIDPDGEKLILGGQRGKAEEDIKSILPSDYKSKIKVNKNGEVKFKLSRSVRKAIEAGNPNNEIDENVIALYELTNSEKIYGYNVTETVEIKMVSDEQCGVTKQVFNIFSGGDMGIENTSLTPFDGPGSDYNFGELLPNEGFDGQLFMAPILDAWEPVDKCLTVEEIKSTKGLQWERKDRSRVVFHELKEMYLRTEGENGNGVSYQQAHDQSSASDTKANYTGIGATSSRVTEIYEGILIESNSKE